MSQQQGEAIKMGDIEFHGKDIATPPGGCKLDRIAVSGRGELLLLSMIADSRVVKQVRAILCGGAKAVGQAGGVNVKQPKQEDWYARQPGRVIPTPDGYQVSTHKLGYGLAHALFLTRMPGFIKVVTEESLWQELNDVRFTTPILRGWMPYIEERLREESLLEDAHVYRCQCGVLSATTKRLDEIVSRGLADGDIRIPRRTVA
jgi:hypothetical protein